MLTAIRRPWRLAAAMVTLLLACHGTAFAATTTELPIKLGDSVDDVKRALGTTLEPEQMDQLAPNLPKKKQLRLKTKGIWVFFEKDRVTAYRVDAPFKGSVHGVHVGDDFVTLKKAVGDPVKTGSLQGNKATYTYYFDDITTTTFVLTNDEVETVFFFK